MAGENGFAYEENVFGKAAQSLQDMRHKLDDLSRSGADLPTGALGVAGWLAQKKYANAWDDLRIEIFNGYGEARDLAEMMGKTGKNYTGTEGVVIGRMLDALSEAKDVSEDRKGRPPAIFPSYRGWAQFGDPGQPPAQIPGLMTAAAGLGAALKFDEILWEQDQMRWEWLKRRTPSRLATCSLATEKNLVCARAFSWTVMAGALAWSATVIPSDDVIEEAITSWGYLAYKCGTIFGYDTKLVREAVEAAWAGPAMEAADARLVDFIAAGVLLTERLQHLSKTLSTTVEDLDRIHTIALAFSASSLALIVGLGIAARFSPALRPAVELLGTRLASVIIVCANIAPAVTAGAITAFANVDANKVTKIGGREVTGFRHL
ncbi:hypothetical protein ACQPYK_45145 [Streptosporangium sp. CA-135522]|uniref:hypothetical protein n=1 Tax=Streptosporangium sp. CA-135522 TaxID=3240072 RepID=UPI003D8CF2EF